MSRLTKEEILNFPKTTYGRALGKTIASKVMNELLQYKDLEEQLGCPLEVVVKAQVSGFYGKLKEEEFCFYNPVEDFIVIDFRLGRIQVALSMGFYNVITFYLTDHKKTWWLKKENNNE